VNENGWVTAAGRQHRILSTHMTALTRFVHGRRVVQVESYPPFQGSEKHYLRAQIARITAETRISPRGYFSLGGKQTTVRTNRLTPFQSRVLSRKCKRLPRHYHIWPVLSAVDCVSRESREFSDRRGHKYPCVRVRLIPNQFYCVFIPGKRHEMFSSIRESSNELPFKRRPSATRSVGFSRHYIALYTRSVFFFGRFFRHRCSRLRDKRKLRASVGTRLAAAEKLGAPHSTDIGRGSDERVDRDHNVRRTRRRSNR